MLAKHEETCEQAPTQSSNITRHSETQHMLRVRKCPPRHFQPPKRQCRSSEQAQKSCPPHLPTEASHDHATTACASTCSEHNAHTAPPPTRTHAPAPAHINPLAPHPPSLRPPPPPPPLPPPPHLPTEARDDHAHSRLCLHTPRLEVEQLVLPNLAGGRLMLHNSRRLTHLQVT